MPFHQYLEYNINGVPIKPVRFLVKLVPKAQRRYEEEHNVSIVYQGEVCETTKQKV